MTKTVTSVLLQVRKDRAPGETYLHGALSGRFYTPGAVRKAVKDRQEEIRARRMMGTLGRPEDTKIRLADVSHIVTSLKLEKGKLIGRFETLDTSAGQTLKGLLEERERKAKGKQCGSFQLQGIGNLDHIDGKDVISDYTITNIFFDLYS